MSLSQPKSPYPVQFTRLKKNRFSWEIRVNVLSGSAILMPHNTHITPVHLNGIEQKKEVTETGG